MKILLTEDLGNYLSSLIGIVDGKFLILEEGEKFAGLTSEKEYTFKDLPENVLYTNGTLENSVKTVLKNKYLHSMSSEMKENIIFDQLNLLTSIISLITEDKDFKLSSMSKEDTVKLAEKLNPIFKSIERYREAKERFSRERG